VLVKKIKFLLGKPTLITGSRPVIAVALSSGLYYSEHSIAQELSPNANAASSALLQKGNIPKTAALESIDNLSLSSGLDIENSTEFFRKLLLSHGVVVNLGENDTIDIRRFTHILESVKQNLSTSNTADIHLDSSLEFTLVIDENELLATPVELDETQFIGTDERWHTVWVQEENRTDSEPAKSLTRNNDGLPDYIDPLISQSNNSALSLVREEQANTTSTKKSGDNSNTSSGGNYREDEFPILRKWIASLGLDIDFDTECQIAVAVILEMHGDLVANKSILESQTPINPNTAPSFSNNVSDTWETKTLDCDLGEISAADINELKQLIQSNSTNEIKTNPSNPTFELEKQNEFSVGSAASTVIVAPVETAEIPDGPTNSTPNGNPDTDDDLNNKQNNGATESSENNTGTFDLNNNIPNDVINNIAELTDDTSENPTNKPAGETQQGIFAVSDDVPEGFEDLAGPQSRFVDIYFNNRKVGDTSITVIDTEFLFDVPDEVAAMLTGIKDDVDVIGLLSQSLPTNGHLVCYALNDPPGCGIVNPDPIAAIYDDNQLRVDLFTTTH